MQRKHKLVNCNILGVNDEATRPLSESIIHTMQSTTYIHTINSTNHTQTVQIYYMHLYRRNHLYVYISTAQGSLRNNVYRRYHSYLYIQTVLLARTCLKALSTCAPQKA